MRCGLFAIFSCLAILSTGCGTDTTNRGGMNSGPRTTNKPVVEERTGDQSPASSRITTDHMPPAGQPTLPAPNLAPNTDDAPTAIPPSGTVPSTTDRNSNTTPPL